MYFKFSFEDIINLKLFYFKLSASENLKRISLTYHLRT